MKTNRGRMLVRTFLVLLLLGLTSSFGSAETARNNTDPTAHTTHTTRYRLLYKSPEPNESYTEEYTNDAGTDYDTYDTDDNNRTTYSDILLLAQPLTKGYFANENYIRMEGTVAVNYGFAFTLLVQGWDLLRWDCYGGYYCAIGLSTGQNVLIYGHASGTLSCKHDPPCTVIEPDYIYFRP